MQTMTKTVAKKRLPKTKHIGQYLQLDSRLIHEFLKLQKSQALCGVPKLFGEILVEKNVVTRKKLAAAVDKQKLDRLEGCSVFHGIGKKELKYINGLTSNRVLDKGQEFIVQETVGQSFYIIIDGCVQVFRQNSYGEEIILKTVGPDECIGEMGYFSSGRRSASVRTLEKSLLLEMDYKALDSAFIRIPLLAINFLKIVTQRLRQSNLKFQEAVKRTSLAEGTLHNLQRVLDLSEVVSLNRGIEDLIERIVLMASKAMNAERSTLFLVDTVEGELWSKVAEGESSREIRTRMDCGIAGWVAQNEQILNIPDAYADPRFNAAVDRQTGYQTRSVLCGPIISLQGELIGVIEVINKKDGVFTDQDEAMFKSFAYQSAISLENFFLSRKLLRNYEKMTILLDVNNAVSQTLDLESLIVKIVDKISQILNAERTSLFLWDRQTDELWSKVAQGSEITEIRFPRSCGLAGYVVNTGETVNIKDAYTDGRFNQSVDEQTGFRTRSVLCVPVINRQGEIIGVTEVINKNKGVFDTDDEELLQALSSQISVSLENAQLFEKILEMKTYLESINASISNSIISLDSNYRIVTANRSALSILNCDEKSISGRDVRDVIGHRNKQIIKDIGGVYASESALADYDVDLLVHGGKRYSVNLNVVPLQGYQGKNEGLVVVLDDITEKNRLKGTLGRYMSKDIVERVLNDPDKQLLGGKRNKATILFSDIRGFTGITESLSGEQTVNLLNECFTVLTEIIFRNKGILDKYMGDSLMAVFGVLYPRKDDSLRAVRAALKMQEAMRQLNEQRRSSGLTNIKIGVGIATGEVIAGNIGSKRRMDFTVIGDDVNVSERLEKLNKRYGTEILISESTCKEIEGAFCIRSIDRVVVTGRKRPIEIFEVLGENGYKLSPAQMRFTEALALYRENKFEQASRILAGGAKTDPVSQIFLSRCNNFIKNPPPPGWDGLWAE